ncbi:inner membrane protein [Aeromonas caviae]|uniref:YbaN family protein n=1 Tax=Aeromonas TaxID=642 RepID=UPI00116311B8|nr:MULTISPECIES: YbaN family protein [Aeromonas]MBL0646612.1 YbaN family protein [Aeromonas caviae]MBP4066285.1 YbaN family protein [Aeromonas sp. MaB10011B]MBP4080106.1 YbaN family protein [Aeromonas sp. MrichA-1]MDH1636570.1 YbaN family protein [Aeromonas caviae]MDX7738437.1 YbaN family protein [Aeromonas caviae]
MKRWCLMALGWLAFATGIVGIVLPLLPTTPFMLLAAALFARSSPRFHGWLLAHPWFGPPILDWQQYRGIRRHARCRAIIFILISFSGSLLVVPLPWVRWLLVVIMVILLTWLMRLPVLEPVAMKK